MRADPGPHPTLRRLSAELDAIRERSLFRSLEPVDPAADSCFCSNDYLGLSSHPDMAQAVRSALAVARRVASTGSRLLSGHAAEWEVLEQAFADYVGAEASLFFGSGYAANLGLLGSILRPEDTAYSDAANHASLIDGIRLARCRKVIFPHLDLDFLEKALRRQAPDTGERFIVVESLHSMDGDTAPLEALGALASRYGAGLIVDEAHAIGVRGPAGSGLVSKRIRAAGAIVASVHTCGKALGAPGAFVAGSRTLKDFLINRARTFIFSTALPPYLAAQVGAGIRLAAAAEQSRQRLDVKSRLLRERLARTGFDTGRSDSQIVPVILGPSRDALDASNALRSAGFAVRAIRPPTVPEGTARLRLSVRADIADDSIRGLVDTLARWRDAGK